VNAISPSRVMLLRGARQADALDERQLARFP
jgi:hypothetical protein